MHATLEGMLTKAQAQKLDWAHQIPFALFALWQMPHRDTLLSPFELVFGHNVRTPFRVFFLENLPRGRGGEGGGKIEIFGYEGGAGVYTWQHGSSCILRCFVSFKIASLYC